MERPASRPLRIDPWVDIDGALGIKPGEKADVESLPVDESLPVPDELPSNRDLDDDHGLVVEEIPRYASPPRAVALGVPVDIEEHREAFRRKSYPGVVEKAATKETPPPLVPKRTALPEEIPAEAGRAAAALRARGLEVWVTFAQGGAWRKGVDRGECSTCGATPRVMAEEKRDLETGAVLQAHNRPRGPRCPGGSTRLEQGRLECATCGMAVAKTRADGRVSPHDVPLVACPDQRATRLIPGEPRPPATSIAVRALPHTGVAVWDTEPGSKGVVGKFDFAFVVHGRYLVKSSAAEFQRACRGEEP